MRIQVYAIWDKVTESFTAPMYAHNDVDMQRRLMYDEVIQRHIEDYALFCLGEYDTAIGGFGLDKHRKVPIMRNIEDGAKE